jgi:hypothetical protein
MDKLNYVGESDGEHYFQEIGQDGLIRGLNGYFVAKLVDGGFIPLSLKMARY